MVDVCKRVLGKSHCWWNLVLSGVGEIKRKKQPCRLRSKDFTVRVVTKISSCGVNTTSRRGIIWLGISFGSIFLLFSDESSWGLLS